MEVIGVKERSFNFFVIVSLQTIDTHKAVSVPTHNGESNGEVKSVELQMTEIVCFPFIVLELTNNSTCAVSVYDQQQFFINNSWNSGVTSLSTPNLMQCIRKVPHQI